MLQVEVVDDEEDRIPEGDAETSRSLKQVKVQIISLFCTLKFCMTSFIRSRLNTFPCLLEVESSVIANFLSNFRTKNQSHFINLDQRKRNLLQLMFLLIKLTNVSRSHISKILSFHGVEVFFF